MDAPMIFVKPAQVGRRVHFPGREEGLAADGEWVPNEDYWLVRLGHGAVVACDPPPSAEPEGEGDGATDEDAQPTPPARGGKKKRKKGDGATDEDAQE